MPMTWPEAFELLLAGKHITNICKSMQTNESVWFIEDGKLYEVNSYYNKNIEIGWAELKYASENWKDGWMIAPISFSELKPGDKFHFAGLAEETKLDECIKVLSNDVSHYVMLKTGGLCRGAATAKVIKHG